MGPSGGGAEQDGSADASRRLATLYEISKRLTRIQHLGETVQAVIDLVAAVVPARSVLVVLQGPDRVQTFVAAAAGVDPSRAQAHALASYAYLVGAAKEPPGAALPAGGGADADYLVVLPLVAGARPTFGVVQAETAARPGEPDLMFLNAVANNLASALEWRSIIAARQAGAEAATERAEVGQATAERMRARAEALAIENAGLLRQAEDASHAREDVLAVVSHDLRNQVDTILMSVSLLLRWRPQGDQARRAGKNLAVIQRTALGMSRLIGDLLDVASIDAGKLALALAPEDPREIVRAALEAVEEQAAARAIGLSSEVIGPEVRLMCDRQRIQQVFANLIGNALKFTPPGGAIAVRVATAGRLATVTVADTGAGIAVDEVPFVFDRYFRGSRPAVTGTGLGMAIVKGIVEAHGGSIWLESEVGVGTTVSFTLPVAASA